MARFTRFPFLYDNHERRAVAELAVRLQRSPSDEMRFVVAEVTKDWIQSDPTPIMTVAFVHTNQSQGRGNVSG